MFSTFRRFFKASRQNSQNRWFYRPQLETLETRALPASLAFISASSTLRFDSEVGEVNNVTITITASGNLTITDSNNFITLQSSATGLGLTGAGTNTVTSTNPNQFNKLFILLGDLDDTFVMKGVPIRAEVHGDSGNDQITMNSAPADPTDLNKAEGGTGDDTIIGGSGIDVINGDEGDDFIDGRDGDDFLDGGSGDDQLLGGDGDDTLTGGSGFDILKGGDGNDFLQGNSGNDQLFGGDGNDKLFGGAGNDLFAGGDGVDRVQEFGIPGATLTATTLFSAATGLDTHSDVEEFELTGTSSNDVFNATAFTGTAILSGNAGNDTLLGGAGNDILSGGPGNDIIRGNGGIDTVKEVGDANFTLSNTLLSGTAGFGADSLLSIESADLTGAAGNNILNTAAFTLGPVTLTGLGGNDTLIGGAGNDTLDGGTGNNTLVGNAGDDILRASGGNAVVSGGAGNDNFDGSSALTYQLTETADVNFTLANNSLVGVGNDSLSSVDSVTLTGGAGNNTFDVSAWTNGNVTLNGAGGVDTLKAVNDVTTMTLTNTLFTRSGITSSITLVAIEEAILEGGPSANTLDASAFTKGKVTLRGKAGNDTLKGGSFGDILDGGDDTDTLIGGLGVDTLLNGENNTQ